MESPVRNEQQAKYIISKSFITINQIQMRVIDGYPRFSRRSN